MDDLGTWFTDEDYQELDDSLQDGLVPLYKHPVKQLKDKEVMQLAKKSGFVLYKNGIDWSSNYDKEIKEFAKAILRKAQEK